MHDWCPPLRSSFLCSFAAVLREEARNYRISWGDPPDAARRERAWMVAVLRNAWVHDTSDDTQWCPLVDDGLMTARFVNSSQVQVSGWGCMYELGTNQSSDQQMHRSFYCDCSTVFSGPRCKTALYRSLRS